MDTELLQLEYEKVKGELQNAKESVEALKQIMDESRGADLATITKQSTEDQQIGDVPQQLPGGLNGRQTRALVYSELSFAGRMFDKAVAHLCAPAFTDDEQLQFRRIHAEDYELYLQQAHEKLLLLHYEESHRMARKAYTAALASLQGCGR